ncbi:MAG TPA: hypothetical protein VEC16_06880, partial [Alphaproteobacteria bacterium]|nr:hypothetical protein [Alphaproteobacteria bacterium]
MGDQTLNLEMKLRKKNDSIEVVNDVVIKSLHKDIAKYALELHRKYNDAFSYENNHAKEIAEKVHLKFKNDLPKYPSELMVITSEFDKLNYKKGNNYHYFRHTDTARLLIQHFFDSMVNEGHREFMLDFDVGIKKIGKERLNITFVNEDWMIVNLPKKNASIRFIAPYSSCHIDFHDCNLIFEGKCDFPDGSNNVITMHEDWASTGMDNNRSMIKLGYRGREWKNCTFNVHLKQTFKSLCYKKQ